MFAGLEASDQCKAGVEWYIRATIHKKVRFDDMMNDTSFQSSDNPQNSAL